MRIRYITRKWLILILVAVCVAACALCFLWLKPASKSPIEKYNFENCRIGVLNYGCTEVLEYLPDAQCEEFVSILLGAQLSKKGISAYDIQVSGSYGGFSIYLANGDTLLLQNKGQYLVFDEKAYECYDSVGGKLWRYLDDVYQRYYPVNKTQ